jgi:hypothetical protein
MASSDNARKLLIRTALVTGTTVATLFGAQTLAVMDTEVLTEVLTPTASEIMLDSESDSIPQSESFVIQRAAPSVTILRRAGTVRTVDGQNAASQANTSGMVILPPSPITLADPAPIIVQQAGSQVVSAASGPVIVQQPPRTKTRPSR